MAPASKGSPPTSARSASRSRRSKPPFAAWLEVVGGLLLLAGLGTRVSAALLSFAMLVASATAHTGFSAATNGFEYPLTLAEVSAGLALLGPGRLSLAAIVPATRDGRLREVLA
ncbi:MAG TPA: DoxX family membrane protein [Thermoanaerobaculia bacterium]|nr:DoxX family membrane protein [Thermoanaerobaculia bacterium]